MTPIMFRWPAKPTAVETFDELGLRLPSVVRRAIEASVLGHWSADPIDRAIHAVEQRRRVS